MRRVAIVGFASDVRPTSNGLNDAELLGPVVQDIIRASGIARDDIGFIATATSEFIGGVTSTMMNLLGVVPCWPPRAHSHLEGDGAFALYEAWVRILAGEADLALVCAYSRPMADDMAAVATLELDPYVLAPLGPDAVQLAALQARALLSRGRYSEEDVLKVVRRCRPDVSISDLERSPIVASPLRTCDYGTSCCGAAAMLLAADDVAVRLAARPAWITGIDHRIERHALGDRDLASSSSTRQASAALGIAKSQLDVVELHAPCSYQELILVDEIDAEGIGAVNPSGGALAADPIMATGLLRIGKAAEYVLRGDAERVVGHATNGPCLQQNLLCLIESKS